MQCILLPILAWTYIAAGEWELRILFYFILCIPVRAQVCRWFKIKSDGPSPLLSRSDLISIGNIHGDPKARERRGWLDSLRIRRCKFWKTRLQLLAMYGRKSCMHACSTRTFITAIEALFSLYVYEPSRHDKRYLHSDPGKYVISKKNVTILRLTYIKSA